MRATTKLEAIAAGLRHFVPAEPCKHGHEGARWSINTNGSTRCLDCANEATNRHKAKRAGVVSGAARPKTRTAKKQAAQEPQDVRAHVEGDTLKFSGRRGLPAGPALYQFKVDGEPFYIGETKNLRKRLGFYFDAMAHTNVIVHLQALAYAAAGRDVTVEFTDAPESRAERTLLENALIEAHGASGLLVNACERKKRGATS